MSWEFGSLRKTHWRLHVHVDNVCYAIKQHKSTLTIDAQSCVSCVLHLTHTSHQTLVRAAVAAWTKVHPQFADFDVAMLAFRNCSFYVVPTGHKASFIVPSHVGFAKVQRSSALQDPAGANVAFHSQVLGGRNIGLLRSYKCGRWRICERNRPLSKSKYKQFERNNCFESLPMIELGKLARLENFKLKGQKSLKKCHCLVETFHTHVGANGLHTLRMWAESFIVHIHVAYKDVRMCQVEWPTQWGFAKFQKNKPYLRFAFRWDVWLHFLIFMRVCACVCVCVS